MVKNKLMIAVLVLVLIMGFSGVPTTHAAYQLVWSDEFDGTTVNTANWTFETGGGGWGNSELQYYQAANANVSGGILTITAKKESVGGMGYTSARMITKGKRSWKYGQVEARISGPMGKGLWPAFWMLGTNIDTVSWPKCGEIDIMEHVNTETKVYGTIHWDNNGHVQYGNPSNVADPTAWHTYKIEWTSAYIRWYVDGVQYSEANILNNINSTEEFQNPFFILLNLAVGGTWPGNPDATTAFPAYYKVDYVRVYQDVASATPTPAPSGNLALNKAVTVSSTENSGTPGSNAVDGNTGTRWASAFADPQWIRVDLGSNKTVGKVVLKWEAAYAKSYKIQTSTDGTNWTDKYSTTAGDGGTDTITFAATTARYVRMYGTVRATTYGYSLWEFEVYQQ